METRVLVPLADGFEEMEAFTVVDILRRAGVPLLTVGISSGYIKSKGNIKVIPDVHIDSLSSDMLDAIDMIVLPGGAVGAENLKKDTRIRSIIDNLHKKQKYISAICAAPTVLSAVGILDGKKVTAYPSFSHEFKNYSKDRVVIDGNIITSQGPATSLDFALTVLRALCGDEKTEEIKKQILA